MTDIKGIVEFANQEHPDKKEEDALKCFRSKNVGHWPTEEGEIVFTLPDTIITLTIKHNKIECSHDLTPGGQIWLIKNFFQNFKPQALQDIETLDSDFEGDKADPQDFINQVLERQIGNCQFLKIGRERYSFTERIRNNVDGSILFSYEIIDLDNTDSARIAVFAPSLTPIIYNYYIEHNEVVKGKFLANGIVLENQSSENRISTIIEQQPIHTEMVTGTEIKAVTLLTESYEQC